MQWRARPCSAKKSTQSWKLLPRLRKGTVRTLSVAPESRRGKEGVSVMKTILLVTAALVGMLRIAAAGDLPRAQPPPVAAAPFGKYPVGKYPVGKYPVGKYPVGKYPVGAYPQPVVTKG